MTPWGYGPLQYCKRKNNNIKNKNHSSFILGLWTGVKSLAQTILCICVAAAGLPARATCPFTSNFILCLHFPKCLGQTNVILLMKNAYISVKWI